MANDDKPGTNLASGSVIFVALVSTGFYFFHREAPLVDMRPIAEAPLEEHAGPQEVEARLRIRLEQSTNLATDPALGRASKSARQIHAVKRLLANYL
jgi:hypothetical protein